jgi:WD40 repeat protein
MDRTFSIQVFNWEQNRTIAFRNIGYLPIFAVRFDPYDHNRFVTSGYEHMASWKISGTHLSCVSFQSHSSNKVVKPKPGEPSKLKPETVRASLISLDYLSYKLGHSTQSDALFGTSHGELLTFCSGRLLVLNEMAHDSAINCLMVVDQLTSANANIITGGEDGLIKLWDSAVNLLQVVDVRNA